MKFNKQKSIKAVIGFSILLMPFLSIVPSTAFAEVLTIPEAPQSFSVTLPGRGMSMTEVLEKFGEPKVKEAEVGEPPITRWQYENYKVVFEYQYVIHALATNKPMGLMAPMESKPQEPTDATPTTVAEPEKSEQPVASEPAHQEHH